MDLKICPGCGQAFRPLQQSNKYCCRKCYQKARKGGRRDDVAGYSHLSWACPFFKWDSKDAIKCEGGKIVYPDQEAGKRFAHRYCANSSGWKDCTVAKNLLEFYDRKDEGTR